MTRKQILAIILDVCIAAATALCLFFLYAMPAPPVFFRRVLTAAVLAPVTALVAYEAVCRSRPAKMKKNRAPSISTLVLLGEDGRPVRIWDISGKVGLLIGKSSGETQVDIDLSGTDYQTYIDSEHAILNYSDSGWWLQDTSSRNGVGIIREGKELLPGRCAPVRLEPGDVICVARYTRIAVN